MSVNNRDRTKKKKCVLCGVRNAKRFDHFCEECAEDRRVEALEYLGFMVAPPDLHDNIAVFRQGNGNSAA